MSSQETTVSEIAVAQPAAVRVFEQFGIDYCCGGRKPLAEACLERGLDARAVLAAIAAATGSRPSAERDWATAPLAAICTHIVETHHVYVRRELHRLRVLAEKTAARHGGAHPELGRIRELLDRLGPDLLSHMDREELVLFPYITSLERGPAAAFRPACFGSVRHPIRVMVAEHGAAGDAMGEIRQLSGGFTPPAGACPTFCAFYALLAEFEQDLHRHVHLENNVLFPRAIDLEAADQPVSATSPAAP